MMMKKRQNESKLITAINIFIVVSLCLLISYGSHLNTQPNENCHFFGENRDKKSLTIKRFSTFEV